MFRRQRYDRSLLSDERKKPLSQAVKDAIASVHSMMPDETNWIRVKKELLKQLSPDDRRLFSRRYPVTKKHRPFNEFEMNVRIEWKALSGAILIMPVDKMMDGVDPDSYL